VEGSLYYGVIEMTLGAQIMGKLTQVAQKGATEGAATPQAERVAAK
jgi:hypothetical protein